MNNDDWLSAVKYLEFLRDYGPMFTINRMLNFESLSPPLPRLFSPSLLTLREAADGHRDTNSAARRQGRVHMCEVPPLSNCRTSEPRTCQARACCPRVERGALVLTAKLI